MIGGMNPFLQSCAILKNMSQYVAFTTINWSFARYKKTSKKMKQHMMTTVLSVLAENANTTNIAWQRAEKTNDSAKQRQKKARQVVVSMRALIGTGASIKCASEATESESMTGLLIAPTSAETRAL